MAITFLLVVGETVAFRIMEKLSTGHLHECMEPTMETTSFRLNYMYPLLDREDKELFQFMDRYVDTYVKFWDFVYISKFWNLFMYTIQNVKNFHCVLTAQKFYKPSITNKNIKK